MTRMERAEKAVLELVESSDKSKEELTSAITARDRKLTKKHVNKALESLQDRGILKKSGNMFAVCMETSLEKRLSAEKSVEEAVPFAETLRRRDKAAVATGELKKEPVNVDVDDEIRRLEEELAQGNDDSEEEDELSSDAESDSNGRRKKVSFGVNSVLKIDSWRETEPQVNGPSVLCFSAVAGDRIEPLPESCLPRIKKRIVKGDVDDLQPQKKRKPNVSEGLREAVKEVLSGYVARSSERLPFYCRVCAKQYSSEQEFFDHKTTDFHKAAVEGERKASFCKLCRKQFTSPVQLKEHISSRPHKQRLVLVKSRQVQATNRRHVPNGQSRRQWC